MATIAKGKMVSVGSLFDAGAPIRDYKEAAAQIFLRGSLVQLGKTGTLNGLVFLPIVVATDLLDISEVQSVGNGPKILGLATKNASGVTGAICQVAIIRPGDLLECNLVQGTVSPGTDHVSVQADIGATCGFLYDSAAKQWYATTDITEPAGKIIDIGGGGGRGVLGDTNIRCLVTVNSSFLLAGGVSSELT